MGSLVKTQHCSQSTLLSKHKTKETKYKYTKTLNPCQNTTLLSINSHVKTQNKNKRNKIQIQKKTQNPCQNTTLLSINSLVKTQNKKQKNQNTHTQNTKPLSKHNIALNQLPCQTTTLLSINSLVKTQNKKQNTHTQNT